MMRIDAFGLHYRELNQIVRDAVAQGEREFELVNVNGQRYIADGITAPIKMDIYGVPGNDLAAFMSGPRIVVWNNAQDGIGNTMDDGEVVVHGHAGDVLGYGMRGGRLLIKGRVGYRVGIHMKEYMGKKPVLVAGGCARDFFGEYMAGGDLILLGLERRDGEPLVGDYCATGIHGGRIFLRGEFDEFAVMTATAKICEATAEQMEEIRPHLEAFCKHFGASMEEILAEPFFCIAPKSHRPYGAKYA